MHVTFDPAADALYVRLTQEAAAGTEEVAPNVNLDLDATGNPVGVEVLGVSHRKGLNPNSLTFEVFKNLGTVERAAE